MESSSVVAGNVGLELEFPNFSTTTDNMNNQITLAGESYLRGGVVGLTRAIGNIRNGAVLPIDHPKTPTPRWSAGAMVYKNPISLFDPQTNTASSFSTNFSFSIPHPYSPTEYGDGFALFFSPNSLSSSSSGFFPGPLGLPTTNNFVAVEFDTRPDPEYLDVHNYRDTFIRLNINNSLKSPEAEPFDTMHIDLTSGETINAWIDYKSDCNSLEVFLRYLPSKPRWPLLTVRDGVVDDLSKYFRDNKLLYVGFSASSQRCIIHPRIHSWSFHTIN